MAICRNFIHFEIMMILKLKTLKLYQNVPCVSLPRATQMSAFDM